MARANFPERHEAHPRIWRQHPKMGVFVTHRVTDSRLADRVVVLVTRPGTIEAAAAAAGSDGAGVHCPVKTIRWLVRA